MVASMNETARLAVVLPNGVFFRGGAELAVRKDLVDGDLVEAIVQLPVDLFYGAGIPACVLVLNRAKTEERKGRVLMIDNSTGFERRDTKNVLTEDAITRVVATFKSGEEDEGFAHWVSIDAIVEHHYNLVVARYVGAETETTARLLMSGRPLRRSEDARAKRAEAEARTRQRPDESRGGLGVGRSDWATVALGDVAELDIDAVPVEPDREYRMAGLLIAGQGLFWRPAIIGSATAAPKLHRLHTGQLVYAEADGVGGPDHYRPRRLRRRFRLDRVPDVHPRLLAAAPGVHGAPLPTSWLPCRDEDAFHWNRGTAKAPSARTDFRAINVVLPPIQQRESVAAVADIDKALASYVAEHDCGADASACGAGRCAELA